MNGSQSEGELAMLPFFLLSSCVFVIAVGGTVLWRQQQRKHNYQSAFVMVPWAIKTALFPSTYWSSNRKTCFVRNQLKKLNLTAQVLTSFFVIVVIQLVEMQWITVLYDVGPALPPKQQVLCRYDNKIILYHRKLYEKYTNFPLYIILLKTTIIIIVINKVTLAPFTRHCSIQFNEIYSSVFCNRFVPSGYGFHANFISVQNFVKNHQMGKISKNQSRV